MLVFGDDNGVCSLYSVTNEKLEEIQEEFEDWGPELDKYKIEVEYREYGYVPDYVVQLSKIYGFDIESN